MRCNYACPLTAGSECPHAKDGADHVPLILLSSVYLFYVVYKLKLSQVGFYTYIFDSYKVWMHSQTFDQNSIQA